MILEWVWRSQWKGHFLPLLLFLYCTFFEVVVPSDFEAFRSTPNILVIEECLVRDSAFYYNNKYHVPLLPSKISPAYSKVECCYETFCKLKLRIAKK